ncbi:MULTISPECIES: hypothetical protein [Candidatus Ichthyocystis]|nr:MULTISPECIES: hypothetical protein [Ichthyocystis]
MRTRNRARAVGRERMVDIEERDLELDRLRMEARVGANKEDVGLAL